MVLAGNVVLGIGGHLADAILLQLGLHLPHLSRACEFYDQDWGVGGMGGRVTFIYLQIEPSQSCATHPNQDIHLNYVTVSICSNSDWGHGHVMFIPFAFILLLLHCLDNTQREVQRLMLQCD